MANDKFNEFLDQNRQPGNGPVDVRGGIAKMREKKASTGVVPWLTNAVNSMSRGMTQVAELPYNIMNNAPQLVNLLPGEQGMGTLDEMGAKAGGPIGNMFAKLGKDPLIDFVGENYPGMDQVGGINQPNPEYPMTNRIMEDVGVGIGTMGAGTFSTGAKEGFSALLGKYLGKPLMDAPVRAVTGEVLASSGAEAGRQVANRYDIQNPVGRFALETVGAMTPTGVVDMAEAGGRRLLSREGADQTLEAIDRLGMRPSIGLTGNQNASTLENAAAIIPGFGSVAKNVQTGQIDDFGSALKNTAEKVRPGGAFARADDIMIGEQVHDIAKSGLGRMKDQFSKREEALMATLGKDTPIDISNIRNTFKDQLQYATGEVKNALQKQLSALESVADDAGNVPAQSLRNWRSNFGAGIEEQGLLKGAKSQVYKSVTADLQQAADTAGVGREFTDLMSEQARAYDDTLRLSEGGDIPAMENIATKQTETGKAFFIKSLGNPDRVELLKRNATPEQWQQFAGDTLEYLGLAKDSAQGAVGDLISPNTFLTNWNKLDPRVKNIMFDDNLGTRQTLDDLAIVAEAMRQRGNSSNFSNTAGVGMSAAALSPAGIPAAAGNIPGAVVGAAMTYATIKGLMSETMARWAANQGIPLGEKMTTKAITGAAKAGQETEQTPQRKFTPKPQPVRVTVRPSDANR